MSLTPSAVSHAVSSMEKELGFSLFTRSKAGVALTNYGERLLPYVNAVLNSDESLQQVIAGLNGLQQGDVKVGCFSSVCTNWMTDIIRSFREKYPAIHMEILPGNVCGCGILDQKRYCGCGIFVCIKRRRASHTASLPGSAALCGAERILQTGRYAVHDAG